MGRVNVNEEVLDLHGNAVEGAVITVTDLAGNPQALYSSETGTSLAAGVSDSTGRLDAWVDVPEYDLHVTAGPVNLSRQIRRFHRTVHSYGLKGDGAQLSSALLQLALNSIGGPGVLDVPTGTYIVDTTLNVPSGVLVRGEGAGRTILKASATLVGGVIQNSDTANGNNDVAYEDLEVDANKTARAANGITTGEGIRVVITGGTAGKTNQRCHVRRCYVHDCPTIGIQFASVQNFSIMDNTVENNGRDGITHYYDCQHGTVEGNKVRNVGDDCIGLNAENGTTTGHTMRDITVVGNVLEHGPLSAQGVGIACSGLQDSAVTGNTIRAGFGAGISVQQWNTTPARNLNISGNTIINPGQYSGLTTEGSGIQITGGRTSYSQNGSAGVSGIHVFGNVIRDPHVYGVRVTCNSTGPSSDIRIEDNDILFTSPLQSWVQATSRGVSAGTADAAFDGLSIVNNRVNGAPEHGMLIGGGATGYSNVVIERNRVRNSGQSSPSSGIFVTGTINTTVDGNHCNDSQGTPTQTYGIEFSAPTGFLTVRNNVAVGNVNNPAIFLTTGDSANTSKLQIAGNVGWTPNAWHGVGVTATAAWNAQTIGAATVYYKDVAITFAPAFPTGVTPALNVTVKDRTGYTVVPINITNLGFTARVVAPGDPGSTTNANISYIAEAP
jgi:hypothetical protein